MHANFGAAECAHLSISPWLPECDLIEKLLVFLARFLPWTLLTPLATPTHAAGLFDARLSEPQEPNLPRRSLHLMRVGFSLRTSPWERCQSVRTVLGPPSPPLMSVAATQVFDALAMCVCRLHGSRGCRNRVQLCVGKIGMPHACPCFIIRQPSPVIVSPKG